MKSSNENCRLKRSDKFRCSWGKVKANIISQLPDMLYIFGIRAQSFFNRSRMMFKKSDDLILVSQGGLSWWTHRRRVRMYGNGLLYRGNLLGTSYLLPKLDFMDGDVVLDCGANMGDLQLYFKVRGVNVDYIGVEPNPIDFRCLTKNTLPGKALNIALWNSNSTMIFYVDTASASSSLIQPPFFTEKIEVPAVRIDSLELPSRIKLFKVEGEGAEPEILEGAQGIFSRIEYISVDAGPERGINQTSTSDDVIKIMTEAGFKIVLENPYFRKTILFKNGNLESTN